MRRLQYYHMAIIPVTTALIIDYHAFPRRKEVFFLGGAGRLKAETNTLDIIALLTYLFSQWRDAPRRRAVPGRCCAEASRR